MPPKRRASELCAMCNATASGTFEDDALCARCLSVRVQNAVSEGSVETPMAPTMNSNQQQPQRRCAMPTCNQLARKLPAADGQHYCGKCAARQPPKKQMKSESCAKCGVGDVDERAAPDGKYYCHHCFKSTFRSAGGEDGMLDAGNAASKVQPPGVTGPRVMEYQTQLETHVAELEAQFRAADQKGEETESIQRVLETARAALIALREGARELVARKLECRPLGRHEPTAASILSAVLVPPSPSTGRPLGTLTLGAGLRWLTHPTDLECGTCFIRPVYEKMYDYVTTARNTTSAPGQHLLFIGNPGIGKTWALNYCLYRALSEPQPGLVLLRTVQAYYAFQPDGTSLHFDSWPREFVRSFNFPRRPLLLFDVGAKMEQVPLLEYDDACVVVATSPNRRNFGTFASFFKPTAFYVPTWSKEEFVARFDGTPHQHKAIAEYDKFGGVLRDAFTSDREQSLDIALQEFDFGRTTAKSIGTSDTHRIVQIVPKSSGSNLFDIAFLTPQIENMWWDLRHKTLGNSLIDDVGGKLKGSSRGIYGKVFEEYVHKHARKLDFGAATLLSAKKPPQSCEAFATLTTPKKFVVRMSDDTKLIHVVSQARQTGEVKWIVPSASNYPVFDAFLVTKNEVFGVQVTISASHEASNDAIRQLEAHFVPEQLSSPSDKVVLSGIVWVVDCLGPSQLAVTQTMGSDQRWNKLPQFRILVSCNEHAPA